jgi:hypothetical protein
MKQLDLFGVLREGWANECIQPTAKMRRSYRLFAFFIG